MSERERKALEQIGKTLKGKDAEDLSAATAMIAAYAAGKAAGEKKQSKAADPE